MKRYLALILVLVFLLAAFTSCGMLGNPFVKEPTVDENGIVLWEWIISANTSADRVRIILRSEDTTAQLYIDII